MPQLIRVLFILVCLVGLLPAAEEPMSPPVILFYGDSLTAGYGIDPDRAYPALIQAKLDEAQIAGEVVVGAVSGDTSAGGLRRLGWMLRRPVDVFVLALGSNDGLRGMNLDSTEENLQKIIDRVRAKNPKVQIVVAGMLMPPNLGLEYTQTFKELFPRLAEANDAALIPFLLEGVAGRPELNLPDRIHPTAEGHAIMAETVWLQLEPLLEH